MSQIKLLVMDVDGTLTDGKVYMGENGELMKAFDIKDGYAIKNILPKIGVVPVIITGRTSHILLHRCEELGITEVQQGIEDKVSMLSFLIKKYNVTMDEVAYIGDDLNDLDCMKMCGVTGCPADAASEVKKYVSYVCEKNGGNGAVREFVEWLGR